jgi:hypothetical protein
MKYILLLLVSITSLGQSIDGRYEFSFRENRTPDGWSTVDVSGEVVFNNNEVEIITLMKREQLYVKSKQLFIRQKSFLYTLVDNNYRECSFRVVVKDTLNTIELYYYSDRVGEKYYRLNLVKCL